MALYALGDLHLSFGVNKPMDCFGAIWKDHPKKIEKHWRECVKPEDTIVLTGDHTWGNNRADCQPDLAFIESLPGRKILLRGNHDHFWEVKKTARLNEQFAGRLSFLQDNYYAYGDIALVGSKGICYEGRDTYAHFELLREREAGRVRTSFEKAVSDGYQKFILFLHYPPTSIGEQQSVFTEMAKEYGAERVIYSHCHGQERFHDSLLGVVDGIRYQLVSGDYLDFCPYQILP